MKIVAILVTGLILAGCSGHINPPSVKFGKKCTPDHKEWSYVWFVEKEGNNVAKENCKEKK